MKKIQGLQAPHGATSGSGSTSGKGSKREGDRIIAWGSHEMDG